MLSSWFDRLTTIGFFPNVLSKVEGQAKVNGFLPFVKGGKDWVSSVYSMMDRLIIKPERGVAAQDVRTVDIDLL